jgi:uncharacterized protein (TIGR03000 family)
VAPAAPAAPAAPVEPRRPEAAPPPVKQDAARGARARLIVELPADAKLFVDGVEKDGGAERRFFTPDLEPGQEYFYTLRVEGLRDGQPFLEQRRVLVKAGAAVRLTFGPQGDPAVAASK